MKRRLVLVGKLLTVPFVLPLAIIYECVKATHNVIMDLSSAVKNVVEEIRQ